MYKDIVYKLSKLTRDDGLPLVINCLDYKVGIEIGVREGGYARHILEKTKMPKFYGLDILRIKNAENLTVEYPGRYIYCIGNSHEYYKNFKDDFFDFIHIDAGHSYEDVKKDLNFWYPKLKKGGLFSGDDYINFINPQEGKYGVVEAVNEFINNNNLTCYCTGIESHLESDRDKWATKQGRELTKKWILNCENNFEQTPCWYLWK